MGNRFFLILMMFILENLVKLKELMKDPKTRENIVKLDTCSNPMKAFQEVMENEDFVEFSQFVTSLLNETGSK